MKNLPLVIIALTTFQLHAGTSIAAFNDNATGPLGNFTVGAGQEGGIGWLTGDTWANTATIAVIDGDLDAPISTGYAVTQFGTPQSVQGTFTSGRQNTRAVETALTGTVWFSYLLNQPTLDSRGGITLNQNISAPGNPRIVSVGTETRLGLGATLQPAGGGVDLLTLGETALILGRLTIDNTGNPDVLDLWINPDVSGDAASLPAPDTTLTEETPGLDAGVTRIGVQSYAADAQGGIIDSLRVSDAPDAFEVVTRDTVIVLDDPNLAVSPLNPFAGSSLTTEDSPLTVDITLENTGEANTLTIADTTAITGDDSASYSIVTALPLNIAPGATAILQLQLDPAGAARNSSASLDLVSNDSSTPSLSISLGTRIFAASGNQLLNGDFEADPASPVDWLNTGNTTIAEGIAPGSTSSASLAPLANLRQNVVGEADWYMECFFQAPDTLDRAFNVLISSQFAQLNLRYQGTSDGAEQTWNLYDNATTNDLWGDAIALPAVQPGATYFLRIIGKAWDGIAPTYDIQLSAPNSLAIGGIVTDLNRYQESIPTGAPNLLRFSAEYGNAPGFILDDVQFINGTPPPSGDPKILAIVYDANAQTTTLTFATQIGLEYSVQAADDLENWLEIDDFTASGTTEVFVENNVTSTRRYYRLLVIE